LTAAVTGAGKPTGQVTFLYGSTTLGAAKLNSSGVATFAASSSGVPAGSYAITASYSGDSENIASTSAPVAVTVQ
jgi:hypothetical protein